MNGKKIQTEFKSPYAIKGDNGKGNYYTWDMPTGEIKLSIVQTLKAGGSEKLDLTYTVTEGGGSDPSPAASSAPVDPSPAGSPARQSCGGR